MSAGQGKLRVTVWHEFVHEKISEHVRKLYPDGMHAVMKSAIEEHLAQEPGGVEVRTATQDQPRHGLTKEVLEQTDVLTWWGHRTHGDVSDEVVDDVYQRVLDGMGLVVLHSGHYSKIFRKLMGTGCGLKWREAAERERIWCVSPGHPITKGLEKDYFEIDHAEMYGEHFDIPEPDELVFISWFEGGEVFRSGCVWKRGRGRIFYFRPGHESFPIYYQKEVRQVLANGVKYVAPTPGTVAYQKAAPNIKVPLSPIASKHEVDENLHKH